MTVLSFHFSSELPSLTFPTIGAQIFGSPPIVFFSFSYSTIELAPSLYSFSYGYSGALTLLRILRACRLTVRKPQVERRISKGDKWNGVTIDMLGQTSGLIFRVVADDGSFNASRLIYLANGMNFRVWSARGDGSRRAVKQPLRIFSLIRPRKDRSEVAPSGLDE